MTSRTVSLAAPAKVNLFLRVLDRRADGYHELETLFQSVSLTDEVSVTLNEDVPAGVTPGSELESGRGSSTIRLQVEGADLGPAASNLAYRAAQRFVEETGLAATIDVTLVKNIPAGAGLGGGSSDAAAVLRCLADLTDVDDPDLLFLIGSELGSDVAFFLAQSPTVLGKGRGEVLRELTPLPQTHLVLALPPVHVSTVDAYGALASARAALTGTPEGNRVLRPEPMLDLGGLELARALDDLAHNDFESVVAPTHSEIGESIAGLRAAGASPALLSGSGAASFGVFPSEEAAEQAARELEQRLGWPFLPVRTLERPTGIARGQ